MPGRPNYELLAYAIKSPAKIILWTTLSMSKGECIKKCIQIRGYTSWSKAYYAGYRVIHVGEVS